MGTLCDRLPSPEPTSRVSPNGKGQKASVLLEGNAPETPYPVPKRRCLLGERVGNVARGPTDSEGEPQALVCASISSTIGPKPTRLAVYHLGGTSVREASSWICCNVHDYAPGEAVFRHL